MDLDLFNEKLPEYAINKKIRLIELFAGVGAQSMTLERIGVEFEHYIVCEFDSFAIKSYNAIHGTSFTTSDIRNLKGDDLKIVDKDKYEYIMFYSFPCQSLSVAGKQEGMKKGSGTRSGLLWEVERLLNETKELPQILIMENVTQVHGKKNLDDFNLWCDFLHKKGYRNYYKDINAKNYGVAQNRNRCFMISLLGDFDFQFPVEMSLNRTMLDYLEDKVDDKFYIQNEKADNLILNLYKEGKLDEYLKKN